MASERFRWTDELHAAFLQGVEEFGTSACADIRDMLVKRGLVVTSDQVKSHMQVLKKRKQCGSQVSGVFVRHLRLRNILGDLQAMRAKALEMRLVARLGKEGYAAAAASSSSAAGFYGGAAPGAAPGADVGLWVRCGLKEETGVAPGVKAEMGAEPGVGAVVAVPPASASAHVMPLPALMSELPTLESRLSSTVMQPVSL
jgi:SHAQKYF class myb-like DNA-binding protein